MTFRIPGPRGRARISSRGGRKRMIRFVALYRPAWTLLFHNFAVRQSAEELHQLPLFGRLQDDLHAGDVVDHQDLSVTRNRPFFAQIVQQAVFRLQELLRHVRGRRQEPLPRDAEETRPLIRQGFGMPFDRVEDPVDDPPGRFFRKTADAFDPARSDIGRKTIAAGEVERSVKRGLPVEASGIPMVIQDQFVDPFITVRGDHNEGVLQVALDLDRTGREGARMKLPEDPPGKEIQVAGNDRRG